MLVGGRLPSASRMTTSAPVRPAALLERERELEQVRAAVRAVGQRAGKVLVIEGAAGMGKSSLLEEARLRATDLGFCVLSARATELEQGFPFGVVRQLFERQVLDAGVEERERWLAGAAALSVEVLTGSPAAAAPAAAQGPGPIPAGRDPGYAWQHGLYWLASNIAGDAPLALLVDDLQWCDATSARTLAFIARRLEGQPLALILATRPLHPTAAPESAMLVADPAAEVLRLSPLTDAGTGALIAARLSSEPDERFVSACIEVTGGNPFLVGELLDEVAARGLGAERGRRARGRHDRPSRRLQHRAAPPGPARRRPPACSPARSARSATARRSATRPDWPDSRAPTSRARWRRWSPRA